MNYDLNYKNIILKHRESIVSSRSECDISQVLGDYQFACPVTMSNMKSIQSREILRKFDSRNWFYIYHRIDGNDDIYDFVVQANEENWNTTSISVGIQESDCKLLKKLKSDDLAVDFITIDVALSHTKSVEKVIDTAKKCFPDSFIICGNGSTPEWVQYMEKLGVGCVKMGIGVSKACFVGDTLVNTKGGLIPINEIQIGHKVLTHKGNYKKVVDLITKYSKDIYDINGEQCTGEHKFYVINETDRIKIDDNNIHDYAYWLRACDINPEKHLLIELE